MLEYKYRLLLLVVLVLIMTGCASKAQHTMKEDFDKSRIKLIAVLPVDNKTTDIKAPQLLRLKVVDELYFKGYTKIPLELIDKKLELLYSNSKKEESSIVAPSAVKELIDTDAVMYCTLSEGVSTGFIFYAPVTVAAECQLRSTKTGEILWSARYKSTDRNFDFTSKRLELKSYESFDSLIEEIADKLIETLPVGPNLLGQKYSIFMSKRRTG